MSLQTPPSPAKPTRFVDAVRRGVLVVDGGMGTQIYERGVLFNVNYEDLVVSRPDPRLRHPED